MNQDCASTDDITGSPGIGITYKSCDSDMIEVTRVEIIEEGTCENINQTVIDYDPPVTSGNITYISKTTELQPGVPLADQLGVWNIVPQQILVLLSGNDEDGNPISGRFAPSTDIVYNNECGSGPIEFNESGLGNVRFVSTISIYFVSTTHYPLE
jgi:hypothetical protein